MSEKPDDLRLLSLANEKRKFGLDFGYSFDPGLQAAFERGIDNEWFTLVDFSPVAAAPGKALRIFRLTDAGLARLAEVRPRRKQ
jgi:hypothetical protein